MVVRQQGRESGGGRLRENLQNLIWELLHRAMIRKKGEIITFSPTKKSILFETDWPDKYKTDFYKILEE